MLRAAALFAGAAVACAATPPSFIWASYGADPTTELTLTWGSASACAPAAAAYELCAERTVAALMNPGARA